VVGLSGAQVKQKIASFFLVLIIAMTPAAREAFTQITGAWIVSGIIDLQETEQFIKALGIKDGLLCEITSRWVGGRPAWIKFQALGAEI